jgi:hypothetical protein
MHKSLTLEQPMVVSRQGPRKKRILKSKIDELQTELPEQVLEPSGNIDAISVQLQKK